MIDLNPSRNLERQLRFCPPNPVRRFEVDSMKTKFPSINAQATTLHKETNTCAMKRNQPMKTLIKNLFPRSCL